MKYTYHYHAIIPTGYGELVNLDGILQRERPINNYTRYLEVKKVICEMDEPHFDHKKLTICTLALLEVVMEEKNEIQSE